MPVVNLFRCDCGTVVPLFGLPDGWRGLVHCSVCGKAHAIRIVQAKVVQA